jgi:hypothetical protein
VSGGSADGGLNVVPTGDGLALRDQPALAGSLIKRLPMTATLKVLEPAAQALPKLGVQGQWVNVRDVTGTAGFVAAWYVTEAANPAQGVKAPLADGGGTPPPAPPAVIVRTAADSVALRRSPAVAADNLIEWLPLRAQLLLLDPAQAAQVGQQGQWLHVRDLDQDEGYVAAWFVGQ